MCCTCNCRLNESRPLRVNYSIFPPLLTGNFCKTMCTSFLAENFKRTSFAEPFYLIFGRPNLEFPNQKAVNSISKPCVSQSFRLILLTSQRFTEQFEVLLRNLESSKCLPCIYIITRIAYPLVSKLPASQPNSPYLTLEVYVMININIRPGICYDEFYSATTRKGPPRRKLTNQNVN